MVKTNKRRGALIKECLSDHYKSMVIPHGDNEEWDWNTHRWIRQGHDVTTIYDILKKQGVMPTQEECEQVVSKLVRERR